MNRSIVALVSVLSASAMLASCTIDRQDPQQTQLQPQVESKPAEKLAPVISVEDGAKGLNPASKVSVKALEDTLTKVTMTNENGKVVKGEMSADGKSWHTAEVLGFYRTYTVRAEGSNGKVTEHSFSTATPAGTTAVGLGPLADSTVGVGQTISMRFGVPITDRKAAQDAITVTTEPKQEGAFYWLNDYELRWRPKEYWQPGTKVSVKADIYGADLGGGVFGGEDNATNFTVQGGYRAVADDATKTMTIYDGNNVVKTMPISMGSNRWPTPNGTYLVGDEHSEMVMDSESFGLAHDKGGYRTKVQYATQLSYSGIFVHSAPWSVWAQGSQNTSHGCINVSPANASWFQENFKRGDVVEIQNTIGGQLSGYDGLGDWQIPWSEWSKGNA
ncbi:Ig-like domain-containing protein [Staphylococcus chromogenes]|nr:Ig-like domain-containing protein [Staphylococcus chromogenes]